MFMNKITFILSLTFIMLLLCLEGICKSCNIVLLYDGAGHNPSLFVHIYSALLHCCFAILLFFYFLLLPLGCSHHHLSSDVVLYCCVALLLFCSPWCSILLFLLLSAFFIFFISTLHCQHCHCHCPKHAFTTKEWTNGQQPC